MIQLCICIVCCCLVANSWLTLCNHMDYSLPGSSVHGISQARILQWVAISFSYTYVAYIYIYTEAEVPGCWSSDANSRLIGKFPDAGKD